MPGRAPIVRPSTDLEGDVAIVTGGAAGIGRAIVERLALDGCITVVADVDSAALDRLHSELGDRVVAVRADVTEPHDLARLVQSAMTVTGRIDVLVNNAGLGSGGVALMDTDDDLWEHSHALNLRSAFRLTQLVARRMIDRVTAGRIVNITSGAAFRSRGTAGAYTVNKIGLVGLTRAFAEELGPHGIRVNAVAPGVTATAMARRRHPDGLEAQVRRGEVLGNLLERVGQPEDVADAVRFLVGASSCNVTAQVIHVSAGSVV